MSAETDEKGELLLSVRVTLCFSYVFTSWKSVNIITDMNRAKLDVLLIDISSSMNRRTYRCIREVHVSICSRSLDFEVTFGSYTQDNIHDCEHTTKTMTAILTTGSVVGGAPSSKDPLTLLMAAVLWSRSTREGHVAGARGAVHFIEESVKFTFSQPEKSWPRSVSAHLAIKRPQRILPT